MQFAKEEACSAQDLALYAKVSREDIRSGEGSGIPAGYIGVFMKDGSKKDRSEFLDSCRHAINKGPVYLEVERLEYKDVMVLVPDKYFSFDKNNCRDGELLIKIPEKDGSIKLPGKIRKAVMDTEKAMDERKLGLCHSAVDIAFTPRSLSKKQFYRETSCHDKEFSGTEEFVSYVQAHGPKQFTRCVFQDVDFRLAEVELKRRCERVFGDKEDKFKFSEMGFERNGFLNCQSADCNHIQIDLSKNLVREVKENKQTNDFGDKPVELVLDDVRKSVRENSRGGR